MDERELISSLSRMRRLLIDEKKALVRNDVDKLSTIVDKKDQLIQKINSNKNIDIKDKEKVRLLMEEVRSIQELNLLLTEQALSYQKVLLDSVSDNINSLTNTYSSKGKYETNNSISIVDQSI